MPFIGNIVNTVAVVVGSLIGMLLKHGVSPRTQNVLIQGIGLVVIFIGAGGTLQHMLTVNVAADGSMALGTQGTLLLIVSMVLGTVVGQAINIEGRLEQFGEWLRTKVAKGGENMRFTEGFVSTSLVICVGAMAVVGGITDGMGDPSTLFAKSALDFVIVIIFASTMGVGVMFSALPLFLYQGVFELIGFFAGNVMTDAMLSGLSLVGNVLICAVGINQVMTPVKNFHIPLGNMLPALLVPVLWECCKMLAGAA